MENTKSARGFVFPIPRTLTGRSPISARLARSLAAFGPCARLILLRLSSPDCLRNPDHPEDWHFDTNRRWHIVDEARYEKLSELQDNPQALWNAAEKRNSVPAGYVQRMGKMAASLYLIKAPMVWDVSFWKSQIPDDSNPGQTKTKQNRILAFRFGGCSHEFSVTDPEFNSRHHVYERMTEKRQTVALPLSTNVFFCLSLTPELKGRHYKVAATIFEPA